MHRENNQRHSGNSVRPSRPSRPRRKINAQPIFNTAINPIFEKLETRVLLSAAGTLDNNFNTTGTLIQDLNGEDLGTSVAVDSQQGNDLIVAGVSNGDFTISAYA